jgi:putative tryptophan/tyrosine transport system substrate-binding protein
VGLQIGPAESDVEAQRRIAAFRDRMQGLGWVDGRNVRFEYRWGGGDADRTARHAAELVAARPDVIMANSTPVIAALKRATTTIPIVFAVVADPVGDGFVASLSRPGGNITGFSSFDPEIGGKWVQLLKEVTPAMTRVALLFNPRTAPGGGWPFVRPFVEAAARSAGVEALPVPAHSPEEIHRGLTELTRASGSALVAMPDSFVVVNGQEIIRSMEQYRLPAIYPFRHFAEQGGLMSYGATDMKRMLPRTGGVRWNG